VQHQVTKNSQRRKVALETLDKQICDNIGRRKTWLCKAKDRLRGEEMEESANTKRVIQKKMEKVRTQLQKILEDNDMANEMEKLNTEEFVIDIQENERQKHFLASMVNSHVVQQTSKINSHRQVINEMKQQYFGSMLLKFHRVHSIRDGSSSYAVVNIPLQSLTSEQHRVLQVVKLLRCNEIAEMQRNINQATNDGKSWSIDLLGVNGKSFNWLYDSSVDVIMPGASSSEDINEGSCVKAQYLLYPTLAVRTKCQRITQVYLLRQSRRDMITSFHEKFINIKFHKQNAIEQINSALARIEEMTKTKNQHAHHRLINEDFGPENFEIKAPMIPKNSVHNESNSSMMTPTTKRALIDMFGSLESVPVSNRIENTIL
jgi:hypothetical protein